MKKILPSIIVLLVLTAFSAVAKIKIGGLEVTDSNAHYLQYVRHMTVPTALQSGPIWDAGNDVSGKTTAETQAIVDAIKALETSTRQREIYDRMKSTPTEVFEFTSINHAKGVVKQRLETVKMMELFNADARYTYHTSIHPPSTTAGGWEPGPRVKFYFRQISGTPYAAITGMCGGSAKTYGECLGGIMACVWWGASQGMGATGFNGLHATSLNMDFKLSVSSNRNTRPAIDSGIHVPGDWLYFINYNYNRVINTPFFYKKGWLDGTKIYYWSGENSLYSGDNKYDGLGVASKTATQMREEIRTAYNDDLATVITEVGKLGGTYGGMEITEITAASAPTKIQTTNVQRVTY